MPLKINPPPFYAPDYQIFTMFGNYFFANKTNINMKEASKNWQLDEDKSPPVLMNSVQ